MKKQTFRSLIMAAMLMAATNVSAQIDLSKIGKALGEGLTTVISSKNNVTEDKIVGTWSYTEPAISFESSNLLKKAGGSVASSTIEKKLKTQFAKVGIKEGSFKMKFAEDNTFSIIKNGKTSSSGTYSLDGNTIKLSFLKTSSGKGVTGFAQISSGKLSLTFDSSKLLTLMSKVGKYTSNSTLSTISSLAGSYDGMKLGLTFEK